MAVIAQILNGTNLNRDAGFSSLISAYVQEGVRSGFGSDLAVTTNQVAQGMAFIEATRTNVTPNEVFLVPVWVDTATAVDTSGDGYIIIELDQTKINDGSANNGDGTGIATVKKVASLPTSNYIELASLASGVITDTRVSLAIDIAKLTADQILTDEILEKTADNGVLIDGILMKDGFFDTVEQGSNPATPASTHWRLFFKADGLYMIDDLGNVSKLQASAGGESIVLGETVGSAGLALRLKMDGKAYKCSDSPDIMPDSYTNSRFGINITSGYTQIKTAMHKISTDKWMYIQHYFASPTYYVYAKVGTLANGKFTWGSNYNIVSLSGMVAFDPKKAIAVVSSSVFYVAYGISNTIYSKRCTISGTTVSAGTQTTVNNSGITNPQEIAVAPVQKSGTDHVIVGWHASSGSYPYDLRCACVNNTTVGSAYTVYAGTSTIYWDIAYNKEQQVLFTYEKNTDGYLYGRTYTQTINTTTLTANTEQSLVTGIDNGSFVQLEQDAEDLLLMLYFDNTSDELRLQKIGISGTTPSLSGSAGVIWEAVDPATQFSSIKQNLSYARLSQVDDDLWGVVFNGGRIIDFPYDYAGFYYDANTLQIPVYPTQYGEVAYVDISDTDPKIYNVPYVFWIGDTECYDLYYESGENEAPYLVFQDTKQRSYGSSYASMAYRIDMNNFIGFAQETGVLDDEIAYNSAEDENQSGLQAGHPYRLGAGGTLVQRGSGKVVALATSATKVIRKY